MSEDGHNIRTIGSGDELKGALDLLKELIAATDGLRVQIHLVRDANARDMWALIAHFCVPIPQISVGHLASDVEDHDAHMRAKVVGRVQLVE